MRRPIILISILILVATCHHINCSSLDTTDEDDEEEENESVDCRSGCMMHNQCLDPDHRIFTTLAECEGSCESQADKFGGCAYVCFNESDCSDWKYCWAQCLQQYQDYLGSCESEDIYEAMAWLFEDCYLLEDGYGNVMDANDVCALTSPEQIDCFLDCYDAADQCGGDPDPLFDCMVQCLDDYPDDDYDDYAGSS